jgi:hypothetical protein
MRMQVRDIAGNLLKWFQQLSDSRFAFFGWLWN